MMPIEMISTEEFHAGTRIKVLGVGGGGGNAVQHMIDRNVEGVEFVCANTDAQALSHSSAHRTIQLGSTGLGAGSKPDKGRDAAEAAVDEIRNVLDGANMVFITAGMGGGTGTGAAPVIARVAREMGILTVGVVTKPFEWEGGRRMANADAGVAELEENVDSLIVVLNEKLQEVLGDDVTQDEAFAHANDVLKNAVGGIAEIINESGQINVDFEDVKTIMSEPGKAMMGTAVASGPDRARIAAEQAVACPLLEGIDLSGARGVLVLITAAQGSLKLNESKLAMNTIRAYASPDAHIIYGAAYDSSIGDNIRVTVVATGLSRQAMRRHVPPMQVISRTGTDDAIGSFVPSAATPPAGVTIPVMTNVSPAGTVGASVWQTGRTAEANSASARVSQLASSGLEDYEIPAFLRKQAD
jgi:cell division protein FtsZ